MKFSQFLNESKSKFNNKDIEQLIDDLHWHVGKYVKGTAILVKETESELTYKFVQQVQKDPEAGIKEGFAVSSITIDAKTSKIIDDTEGSSKFKTKSEALDSIK